MQYFPCCGGGDVLTASSETHSRLQACRMRGELIGNPPLSVKDCPEPSPVSCNPAVTDYTHFSAVELNRFLKEYSKWTVDQPPSCFIEYEGVVQFARTKEDVSAIYGEAVPLFMQFKRHGYCTKIENAIIGPIVFDNQKNYSSEQLEEELKQKRCYIAEKDRAQVAKKFGSKTMRGSKLMRMVNEEVKVVRARTTPAGLVVEYKVKAVDSHLFDALIKDQLDEAERIYTTGVKSDAMWLYLANVALAVDGFHEVSPAHCLIYQC